MQGVECGVEGLPGVGWWDYLAREQQSQITNICCVEWQVQLTLIWTGQRAAGGTGDCAKCSHFNYAGKYQGSHLKACRSVRHGGVLMA
jgi:hypothetical protein